MMKTASDDPSVLQIVGMIYDAVVDQERWPEVLHQVSRHLSGRDTAFIASSPLTGEPAFSDTYLANHFRETWATRFSRPESNPWIRGGMRKPLRTPFLSSSICSDAELRRTEVYDVILRPTEMDQFVGVNLGIGDALLAQLSVYRSRFSPPFEPGDGARLLPLVAHFERAGQLRLRLQRVEAERRAALEVLDQLELGVVLVERGGRQCFVNRSAQRLLASADGLRHERGRLCAANADESRALAKLLDDAALAGAGVGMSAGGTMLVSRPSGARHYTLLVAPVGSELRVHEPRGVAMVLVGDPDASPMPAEQALVTLYGLTAAEAKVAVALAHGEELSTIAEERGISLATVRTQLYRALAKTGTRRQTDLVRLLLRGPLAALASPLPTPRT
jgi:DNA-binding CsgD family transcriptional regulator